MNPLNSATLPLQGHHLIEASAGTGKTYNIIRLYLRLLLEQELNIEHILVMTFTNAATSELRSRLSHFLRETLNGWVPQQHRDDPVLARLYQHIPSEKAVLLLKQALAQLDQAAIYTIHGFCKRALSQQAFLSGLSFHANLESNTDRLLLQQCQDWYRNTQEHPHYGLLYEKWSTPEAFVQYWYGLLSQDVALPNLPDSQIESAFDTFKHHWESEKEALLRLNKPRSEHIKQMLAKTVTQLDDLAETRELSTPVEFSSDWKKFFNTAKKKQALPCTLAFLEAWQAEDDILRLTLVKQGIETIRKQVSDHKAQLDLLSFNDLITQLNGALADGQRGLAQTLLEQFPAALIDEFQDTDPDQYAILKHIYGDPKTNFLCMIGDPKQAIYSFRGGDIFTYLKAKQEAQFCWTMNVNYRSSDAIIHAYNQAFLQGATHVSDQIFHFGIEYTRIEVPKHSLSVNYSDQQAGMQWCCFHSTQEAPPYKKEFQSRIAHWITQEIIRLLSSVSRNQAPIQAGDIALLVRNFQEAQLLQTALKAQGLNSVYLSTRESIYKTREAYDLERLLAGILQPEDDRLFISALACQWIGLSPDELNQVHTQEVQWAYWQHRFEQWQHQWVRQGILSVLYQIMHQHSYQAHQGNERILTNLLHLAELLQQQASRYKTPNALFQWYSQEISQEQPTDAALLRLENDEGVIRIITLHGSKGLEYPIVFLPFISYGSQNNQKQPYYRYHDRHDLSAHISLFPTKQEQQWHTEEVQAEHIRLLYVAMTRAKERLYACLAPFKQFSSSPLGLLVKSSEYDLDHLKQTLQCAPYTEFKRIDTDTLGSENWRAPTGNVDAVPAQFDRIIEDHWWMSSFSALTRQHHSQRSQPDRDTVYHSAFEEHIETEPSELRFALKKGAETGNLMHDTFEHCDFKQPDYDALFSRCQQRYPALTNTIDRDAWQIWLDQILETRFHQTTKLSDLSWEQTLRESEFHFPMEGKSITLLAQFISKRRDQPYEFTHKTDLQGMMHGFIDLIFNIEQKYFIADYKTTHMGNHLSDYLPDQLQQNVYQHHYDLQYSLYSLALHRYLSARMIDYDPDIHYGGVYYFYIRGMAPNHRSGIYFDRLSSQELTTLNQIFQPTS